MRRTRLKGRERTWPSFREPTVEEAAEAVVALEAALTGPDAHRLWILDPHGRFTYEHAALHPDGRAYVQAEGYLDAVAQAAMLSGIGHETWTPALRLVGEWARSPLPDPEFLEQIGGLLGLREDS